MVCGRIDFFALNSISKILGETVRVCAQMMLDQETNLKRFLSMAADVFKRTRIAIEPTPDGNVSIRPDVGLPADIRTSLSEAILGLVRGHPDYTQRYCSHLYDIITASGEPPSAIQVDESLHRQGLDAMIDGCELIFIPEWQTFPLRQQQVLSLLAEKGPLRRISAVDLAEYEMTHTSFNTALKQLIRKELLREDENGNYCLADPIFRHWIARRAVG